MPMLLNNTLTRKKQPLVPADPSLITFYSCGPTVYDDAHIGNFRSFLAADLLRRWLESPLCEVMTDAGTVHKGPRKVRHIMNITDVGHMTQDDLADGGGEDKMQAAAKRLAAQQLESKKSGTAHAAAAVDPNDPRKIADFYAERFLEDARKLGLKVAIEANESEAKRKELMPKATESIDGMRTMIEDLAAKGFAYRAGNAVYFDVQKYDRYGELSGNTLDKLRGGAGGRTNDAHTAEKKSPADFLLWKADSSHIVRWPGPTVDGEQVGEGYPGWHIECSVMARAALGDEIDLHSGGEDNIFPHHECERAQSCCATGRDTFARHWFHSRFLQVEGEKMSKSKGNFFTPRQLLDKDESLDPAAVRLELIKTHYRTNANFTKKGLRDASNFLKSMQKFARIVQHLRAHPQHLRGDYVGHPSVTIPKFIDAMNNDLNISGALGALALLKGFVGTLAIRGNYNFERDMEVHIQPDDKLPEQPMLPEKAKSMLDDKASSRTDKIWACLHLIDNVLGVIFVPVKHGQRTETAIGMFLDGITLDAEIETLLADRAKARKAKDFAKSDAIRDELAGRGFAIKDIADGKVEISRK